MSNRSYTVSRVARIAHVTVRTLHHYDRIGLLVPSRRSGSGYRLYSADDLQRLQQILLFRRLGFSLDAIRRLLDEPTWDRASALRAQRELLREQVRRSEAAIRAVDATLNALEKGTEMDDSTMFEGLDGMDPDPHAEEARERWGDTDAYRESMRRTRRYTRDDWSRLRAEIDGIEEDFARLLRAGVPAEDPRAAEAAERHRLHLDRWFYPCSPEFQVGLAEMYTADARFREHYDRREAGLAEFVAAAIRANAGRA